MIYQITEEDIRKDNPELKAIREYNGLKSNELKAIFTCYDYGSPYYGMEEERRQAYILKQYSLTRSFFNREDVKNAVAFFKNFMNDSNKEMLELVDSTFKELKDKLKESELAEKDIKVLKLKMELLEKIPSLVEAKKKLEGVVNGRAKEEPKPRDAKQVVREFNRRNEV